MSLVGEFFHVSVQSKYVYFIIFILSFIWLCFISFYLIEAFSELPFGFCCFPSCSAVLWNLSWWISVQCLMGMCPQHQNHLSVMHNGDQVLSYVRISAEKHCYCRTKPLRFGLEFGFSTVLLLLSLFLHSQQERPRTE